MLFGWMVLIMQALSAEVNNGLKFSPFLPYITYNLQVFES